MTILYGVSFPEILAAMPRRIAAAKGIPGNDGWAAWPGWSVSAKGNRVVIKQEVIDLRVEQAGVPVAAKDELEANEPGEKMLRLIYSIPSSMCILHYIEGQAANKESSETAPTPALVKLLAEREKAPPPSRPPGVPTTAYAGPPLTPMRSVQPQAGPRPPGPVRPETPPPSIIVEEDAP